MCLLGPPGSVFGSLLSLVYINDIGDNLLSLSRLFADDTSLGYASQDEVQIKYVVNHDLHELGDSKEESALHINAKELLAAFMAIQTFVKQLQLTIHIKIDNMSAVAYINKMESTKSRDLNLLMKRIWD